MLSALERSQDAESAHERSHELASDCGHECGREPLGLEGAYELDHAPGLEPKLDSA